MKKRWMSLFLCLLAGLSAAWADGPFRNHRYDAFKVLGNSGSGDVVFIGNSITNMHEWWEAFGETKVLNRGVSGAVSNEVVANLGSLVSGKPGKVFLMIGTNDLGTAGMNNAAHVAGNVRTIVRYIKNVSPSTEIYVQSILPSSRRTKALVVETNDSLRAICGQENLTYVDLFDALLPVEQNDRNYTLDGLHLCGAGYRVWCKAIEQYLGLTTTYPDDATNQFGGLGGSEGMRASSFGMLPVADGDILFIGDEMVHGGEWHELLGSAKVKNRGTGWGYPGPGIANITNSVPTILKGRADNGTPAKVFLYAGAADAKGADAVADIKTRYEALVAAVRADAPTAQIYIQALLPTTDATINTNRVVPVNAALAEIAEANENVTYVDDYTPFVTEAGVANTAYINGNYLYGKGYARLAQLLAGHIGEGVECMTEEEAQAQYNQLTARNTVAAAIASACNLPVGTGVGQYLPESLTAVNAAVAAAYAVLAKEGATIDELNEQAGLLPAAVTTVYESINQPLASTQGDEHWYKFSTPERNNLFISSKGADKNVMGEEDQNYARSMWKLETRTDGSLNIINRADGTYLSPASAYNTAIKAVAAEPAAGWTFSYSNKPGTFIISSGTVQLNQTGSAQSFALYNWSAGQSGTDRNDTGCRFAITEAGEPTEEPVVDFDPVAAVVDVTLDGTKPYEFSEKTRAAVFALDEVSVAIDFTLSGTTDAKTLVGSSNSDGSEILALTVFGSNVIRAYVPSATAFYSRNGNVGTTRHQLVVTMKKGAGYVYYLDGSKIGEVNFATAPTFGSLTNANGLYLGGVVTSDNANLMPAAGTIHSARFFDRVLTAGQVGVLAYDNVQSTEPGTTEPVEPGDESDSISVSVSTGTLRRTDGTTTGNFFKTWTSNSTTPTLTLDASANNMAKQDDYVVGYVGSNTTNCTYTLSVPEGYEIVGWSMDVCLPDGSTNAIDVVAGGKTYTISSTDQHVSVQGVNERTATFNLKGGNYGCVFKNFKVLVAESDEAPEPRSEIFITDATRTVVNRIPAIATAHNGHVIAVADYRYSGADIGMSSGADGKIDLRYSISTDNGQTWSDIKTLAAAKGYAYGQATGDSLNAAFGDPCIVADRESDRVLVMSCSGMVSFPNGTRTNHQGIARIYSEDNGATWGAATNIAESIYGQFDKRTDGPVRAMFVGSGKISQSHIIKVGDYYRLYCAVLVKLGDGSNVNFVLYSDDFGGSWTVLGDVNESPIPGGGDEPKADELPDGSVIISSRTTGGRYFNIYNYTDSKSAEGYWSTSEFSGSSNSGTTAQGNSCNGEIMFVPAVRNSDGKSMFLALQSVPFGPGGRNNVGIYYKGLETPADYATPAAIAANWEGRHQASSIGSAYSTMTWQADNTVGFLFEESTYGRDYTIVYKNYTLETITGGKYSFDADSDREAFAFPVTALDARMEAVRGMVGTNVGNLKEEALPAIEAAYDDYVAAPSREAYEAFAAAFAGADDVVTIDPERKYRLRNSDRQNGTLYLVGNADGLTAAVLNETSGTQLFSFIPTEEKDVFFVCNETSRVFIGRTGAQEVKIPVVATQAEASTYRVASTLQGLSSLSCTDPEGRPAIHLAGDCTRLVPWNASGSPASMWYIEPTDIPTSVEGVPTVGSDEEAAPLYDLSGRRVYNPGRGIYIRSGRKFIKH